MTSALDPTGTGGPTPPPRRGPRWLLWGGIALGLFLAGWAGLYRYQEWRANEAAQLVGRHNGIDALRLEIEQLEEALAGDVCKEEVLPISSAPLESGVASSAAKSFAGDLQLLLEHATVFVVAGRSSGTGFFVAPRLVLTNNHVVGRAHGGRAFVTSEYLGRVHEARVLHQTDAKQVGGHDYALLQLVDAPAKPASLLGFTETFAKTERVLAAGYPAISLDLDASFAKLMAGDSKAAPGLNITDGSINNHYRLSATGVPAILHDARISAGNSGGPLVDRCGRVVAVNTFVSAESSTSTSAAVGLAASDVIRYLGDRGVAVQTSKEPCPASGANS